MSLPCLKTFNGMLVLSGSYVTTQSPCSQGHLAHTCLSNFVACHPHLACTLWPHQVTWSAYVLIFSSSRCCPWAVGFAWKVPILFRPKFCSSFESHHNVLWEAVPDLTQNYIFLGLCCPVSSVSTVLPAFIQQSLLSIYHELETARDWGFSCPPGLVARSAL